jgi:hypothetical protein
MSTLATVQKLLASPGGLAAAQAAAAGSTDPAVLALLLHYQNAHCTPSMVQPMPASMPTGTYWIYEPSGRDQCAFSSWNPSGGDPPPPIPDVAPVTPPPAQNIVAALPAAPPPSIPAAPGQNVVSSVPSSIAWLTAPSPISPNVPNYWLVGGALILGMLLFGRR